MSQKRQDRVEFLKPDGQEQIGLHDLSESGAAFLHPKSLDVGRAVKLVIGGTGLNTKVIYSREQVGSFKTGVHFESVTEGQKKELASLVEKFSRGMPIEFEVVG